MIREELEWSEISGYLSSKITTLFVGPVRDERSGFILNKYQSTDTLIVQIDSSTDGRMAHVIIQRNQINIFDDSLEILIGLRSLIKCIRDSLTITCIDLSSLHHATIMFLTKLLLSEFKPVQLYATYTEPNEYEKGPSGEFVLHEELLGRRSVPGFSKRIRENPIRLVPMLGFDGDRLLKLTEELQEVSSVVPIVGFPSFSPGWQTRTLKSSMRAIEALQSISDIHKCGANSIFEAVNLLTELRPRNGETYALAPLGTRPHTMATAIYATRNEETLVLYDHPVEVQKRTIGINKCICYHLTSFIIP